MPPAGIKMQGRNEVIDEKTKQATGQNLCVEVLGRVFKLRTESSRSKRSRARRRRASMVDHVSRVATKPLAAWDELDDAEEFEDTP